ncbi:AraC family transcriptional regulator [Deinococcus cellulosilyticus NBRC 106333 = KACC 11606]|uniref:AraC family transcriptional regulator n=2 Tax=Deinococcus cellulosilyticus TaxID=401558 RepID=A0A511MZN1_DEIC1|nr:AraC family transcriptional regulator [Deinococcus cellulosilyticus NBRC 106333 = KACC 11606]
METQSTLLARSSMNPGWGMQVPATRSMVLHLIQGGNFWLHLPDREAFEVKDGDILLLTRGNAHLLTGEIDSKALTLDEFVRQPAPDPALPLSTLICGEFLPDMRLGKQVVQGLPECIHLHHHDVEQNPHLLLTTQLLWMEVGSLGAGSELLIHHLFDTLFLYVLRAHMEQSQTPGWLTATRDPQVSRALGSMHAEPHAPWTVEQLAGIAGLSRAAFARRFTEAVGQSPLAYLTDWRMHLAARLLDRGEASMYQVASQVGYTSEAAFSRAFKKHHGIAPAAFRKGKTPALAAD